MNPDGTLQHLLIPHIVCTRGTVMPDMPCSPILNKSYDLSYLSRNLDIVRLSYDDLTICYDKIYRKTSHIHKACRSISYDNRTIG
mgnify:CR=1 FL=1